MTRRQVIVGIAALLAVVAFATSWSHCVDVLIYGGQPRYLSWVIASLPEVTCLLVALRLMDGERGPLTWTVGAIGFGFTVVANASTAGGSVDPNTHWLWSELGALWPAVSTVLAFLLMGHSDPTRSTPIDPPIEIEAIDPQPDPIASIRSTIRSVEGIRAVAATRSGPTRSTLHVPNPIDPIAPDRIGSRTTTPIDPPRSDRPAAAWVTRSAIGSGAGSSQPVDVLSRDLRAALRPGDPIPSAESIRTHYRIGLTKARALRDALRTDRSQPGAGGADREIN